jgi:hypothetical protein
LSPGVHSGGAFRTYDLSDLCVGVCAARNGEDEADLELGWNLSLLYYLTPRLETLLEFDGENVFGGEKDEFELVNITPGIKIQPSRTNLLETMIFGVGYQKGGEEVSQGTLSAICKYLMVRLAYSGRLNRLRLKP